LIIYTRKVKLHSRLACRMNVKNETARILRAHAERAVSANVLVKIYFKLYILACIIYNGGLLWHLRHTG